MITQEAIHDTIEQAVTVLGQTWHYDAWMYLSLTDSMWCVEHVSGSLDIAVGDRLISPDEDYPLFEGAVRYPSPIEVSFSRNHHVFHLDKIQASLMHPLMDSRGACFGLFVGLAKRGVSREYDKALPLLSVMGEMIMQSRELLMMQEFSHLQKERALAVAKEDELTRTYNRRGWTDIMSHIKGQMRRNPTTHGIMLLDINDMKVINDEQGHEAGDSYLVHFANTVRGRLREGDIFARLGGDEFVILACNSSEEGMQRLRRDLLECFAKNMINCAIGFSVFSRPEQFDGAINTADMRMYEHKRAMKKTDIVPESKPWRHGEVAAIA